MASDFLLEIEGIKGESKDKVHKETIEVDSFSWGISNAGSHFTCSVGKASANLALSCASGKHIKKAVLYVRKQGETQQDYYVLTLEDLLVSGYTSGDAAGGSSIPTDQFSLNYAKIKYEYKPQKADGSLEAPITMTWDIKAKAK
jgi:type VI secretion system secreted protein Hcp